MYEAKKTKAFSHFTKEMKIKLYDMLKAGLSHRSIAIKSRFSQP